MQAAITRFTIIIALKAVSADAYLGFCTDQHRLLKLFVGAVVRLIRACSMTAWLSLLSTSASERLNTDSCWFSSF